MKNINQKVQNMTRMALCAALLCSCAYVIVPVPFSPAVLSLHTLAVNLTGLLLSPGQAVVTVGLYLLMGLVGLPVFSGGTAGPGKLFGPTGGYYFGFLLAVWAISAMKGSKPDPVRYSLAAMLAGLPLQHLCAVAMLCLYNGFRPVPAFLAVSLPFLPGDMVKCFISGICGAAICRRLGRQ